MHAAASERAFLGASALVFAASIAATIASCAGMDAMGGLPMPGGWTLSMAWMPMCGQGWAHVAVGFLGMWMAMMVAMMLPALVPALRRYRRAVGAPCPGGLAVLVGLGYFSVWAAIGIAIFPAGVAAAELALRQPALARAVPVAAGLAVLIAGAAQFSAWKSRHLACCRAAPPRGRLAPDAGTAWRHGLRLGRHCACSCAGPTAVLLVLGVMDLGAMAAVASAITAERLAPDGERVARGLGAVAIGAGLVLILQAAGFR
jgi:predicted metal-binding membrane protein